MAGTNRVVRIQFPEPPPIGTVVERKSGARWHLIGIGSEQLTWRREQDGYETWTRLSIDLNRVMFDVRAK